MWRSYWLQRCAAQYVVSRCVELRCERVTLRQHSARWRARRSIRRCECSFRVRAVDTAVYRLAYREIPCSEIMSQSDLRSTFLPPFRKPLCSNFRGRNLRPKGVIVVAGILSFPVDMSHDPCSFFPFSVTLSPVVSLSLGILHGWMRTQMLATS